MCKKGYFLDAKERNIALFISFTKSYLFTIVVGVTCFFTFSTLIIHIYWNILDYILINLPAFIINHRPFIWDNTDNNTNLGMALFGLKLAKNFILLSNLSNSSKICLKTSKYILQIPI